MARSWLACLLEARGLKDEKYAVEAVVDQLEIMVTPHLLQLRVARLLQALLLKLLVRRAVEPPREKLSIQP